MNSRKFDGVLNGVLSDSSFNYTTICRLKLNRSETIRYDVFHVLMNTIQTINSVNLNNKFLVLSLSDKPIYLPYRKSSDNILFFKIAFFLDKIQTFFAKIRRENGMYSLC